MVSHSRYAAVHPPRQPVSCAVWYVELRSPRPCTLPSAYSAGPISNSAASVTSCSTTLSPHRFRRAPQDTITQTVPPRYITWYGAGMPKARVLVTLDDENNQAVALVQQRMGVSASRAVNIIMRDGLALIRKYDGQGKPISADPPTGRPTRGKR